MEGYLKKNSDRVHIRKFGVDNTIWAPDKDEKISAVYSHKNMAGKEENKEKLLSKYSLKIAKNAPLVGCIWNGGDYSALKKQVEALKKIGGAMVVADKSASDEQLAKFKEIAPESIGVVKLLTIMTIKQLLAGSDIIILSPDKYKDLLHIKALNYGAVPVVPKTGYFWDDIVEDDSEGMGFLYDANDNKSFADALKRALDLFKDQKTWVALQKRGMKNEFNWNKIAKQYFEIYETLI